MSMTEAEVADVLCVSERKCRAMRETYLEEGKHWTRGEHGEIAYTVDGAAALAGTLGVDVGSAFAGVPATARLAAEDGRSGGQAEGERAQDGAGLVGGVSEQGEGVLKGGDGAATQRAGQKQEVSPTPLSMVRVTVIRTLPNARHYVGKVAGTHRVVKMKTRARMGLKIGRALMCIDHGDWVEFDRRAARMMVQTTGKG